MDTSTTVNVKRERMIEQALNSHVYSIKGLGEEFGHLMTYLKSEETIEPHVKNMVVYREDYSPYGIEGFSHCQPLVSPPDRKFVVDTKCIPSFLVDSAWFRSGFYRVGILMQGGAHRDIWALFIKHWQEQYDELWAWTSILSEGRSASYQELGFSYNPVVQYTFSNPHKNGDDSTYQLGIWRKGH